MKKNCLQHIVYISTGYIVYISIGFIVYQSIFCMVYQWTFTQSKVYQRKTISVTEESHKRRETFLEEKLSQLEKSSHNKRKIPTKEKEFSQQEKSSHNTRNILMAVKNPQSRRKIIMTAEKFSQWNRIKIFPVRENSKTKSNIQHH